MSQNEHYYNIDILKLIFACAVIGLVSLFSAGIYHLIEVPMNHYLRRQKA